MLEVALVTLLTSVPPPQGELVEDLRTCRSLEDNLARLQCYDQATSGLDLPPEAYGLPTPGPETRPEEQAAVESAEDPVPDPAPAVEEQAAEPEVDPLELEAPKGRWVLTTEADAADGTSTTLARLRANPDKARGPRRIDLFIRCESHQTGISIHWGEYMRSAAPAVTVRLDSRPPVSDRWSRSADKLGSIYSPGSKKTRESKVRRFALELLTAKKLVARVLPHSESSITAVFDLTGIGSAVYSVRRACGW